MWSNDVYGLMTLGNLCNRSVFVGQDKVTNEIVALKRINTEQEENGFPITAIREVKILKALNHVNIVKLKEIVTSKGMFVVSKPRMYTPRVIGIVVGFSFIGGTKSFALRSKTTTRECAVLAA